MAKWQKAGATITALVVAMSPAGYRALKSHEGLGQPGAAVQKAYADPYYGWRIATICYGHTAGVKQGDTATMASVTSSSARMWTSTAHSFTTPYCLMASG